MQYDIKLTKCNNAQDKKSINTSREIVELLIILFAGILVSRVTIILGGNSIKSIAPFGISYIMAVALTNKKKYKIDFVAFLGIVIGYITVLDGAVLYTATITSLTLYIYSLIVNKRRLRLVEALLVVIVCNVLCGLLISNYTIDINIISVLVNIFIIIPAYCMIKYAIGGIREIRHSYFYSDRKSVV